MKTHFLVILITTSYLLSFNPLRSQVVSPDGNNRLSGVPPDESVLLPVPSGIILPVTPPPFNDLCSDAEVIPSTASFPYLTSLISDISSASTTGDPGIPTCQPYISRSVWYKFTPSRTCFYTISSCSDQTGTTLEDNVMAVYTAPLGCIDPTSMIPKACDDDACGSNTFLATITLQLEKDSTYYILVWLYGTSAPPSGKKSVQLRVMQNLPPLNDMCENSVPLFPDAPVAGTTCFAANNYQLSGQACFKEIGQIKSGAQGRDALYSFIAPEDASYSARVTKYNGLSNLVLYAADNCPTGSYPITVSGCLAASNRSVSSSVEEITCFTLTKGQQIFLFVDEDRATKGSDFVIEVNMCLTETEPNNTPLTANTPRFGLTGGIDPNGDVDFFSLGAPVAGTRVFAMVDGAAANNMDFDLRVTTATETLEYDDSDNDGPFGASSANIAGTPLIGTESFLRVSQYSPGALSSPYRLYSVIQAPFGSAVAESEPNNAISLASHAPLNYFYGALSGTAPSADADYYGFMARQGDLIFLSLDGDPLRDNTPVNAQLALLNADGVTLESVNDSHNSSSTAIAAGGLAATSPYSPAEALVYRVRESALYYARVQAGSASKEANAAGDYLLSISKNGSTAGGGLPADVAISMTGPSFGAQSYKLRYKLKVTNSGPVAATNVTLTDTIPSGTTFLAFSTSQGTYSAPAVGDSGAVSCSPGTLEPGGSVTMYLTVMVTAPAGTVIANKADVSAEQPDQLPSNNHAELSTPVSDAVSDLQIWQSASKDSVLVGDNLSYIIKVKNAGPADAPMVVVSDTLPAHVAYQSSGAPSGWVVIPPLVGGTGIITFQKATMAKYDSATFTVTVSVKTSAPHSGELASCATANCGLPDPAPDDNTACASAIVINVLPRINLSTGLILTKFGCAQSKISRTERCAIVVTNPNRLLNNADMEWQASTTAPELTLLNASGDEGDSLIVLVNYTGYFEGTYTRWITIDGRNSSTMVSALNSPLMLRVQTDVENPFSGQISRMRSVGTYSYAQYTGDAGQAYAEAKSNTTYLPLLNITVHPCELPPGYTRLRYAHRWFTFSTATPNPDIAVKLYYASNELDPMNITHPENLRVYRQALPGGSWVQVPSTADPLHSCVLAPGITNLSGVWALATPWAGKEGAEEEVMNELSGFALEQIVPNPVVLSRVSFVELLYSIPEDGNITIKLYDLYGREVRTVLEGFTAKGSHRISMNCTGLLSGKYFCQLQAGGAAVSRKVLVLN